MAPPQSLVRERLSGTCGNAITAQAWSADGGFLAMATASGELLLLDVRAGCEELLRGERDSSLDGLGFSPDGRFLMAVGQNGELLLWDMGGTGVRPIAFDPVPLQAGWLDTAAWRPHGALLALGAGRRVRLWDGERRSLREESQELEGTVLSLAWSRDGRRLAAAGHGEVLLWRPDEPGESPQCCATGSAGVALGWSDQGNLLASGRPRLAVQRPPRQGAVPVLVRSAGAAAPPAGRGLHRHRRDLESEGPRRPGLEAGAPGPAREPRQCRGLRTRQQPAGQRLQRRHGGALG
jgi:hypothetical protein